MTVNLATLCAVSTAYLVVGSFPKEVKLIDEFGPAYRDYQRRVPRLVPCPWRRYHPGKKV